MFGASIGRSLSERKPSVGQNLIVSKQCSPHPSPLLLSWFTYYSLVRTAFLCDQLVDAEIRRSGRRSIHLLAVYKWRLLCQSPNVFVIPSLT